MVKRSQSPIDHARRLYDAGQCDAAVLILTEAIRKEPGSRDARGLLAELFVDSERYSDALSVIDEAGEVSPPVEWLALKGLCHEALGDAASAQRVAESLNSLDTGCVHGLVIRGRLAVRSGDAELSESCFREALGRGPQCGLACLGVARLRQSAGDDPACLDWLEKAFRFCPTSREIVLAFHERLIALNRLTRGEGVFRAALADHPLNRRLRFLLIDILLRQGRLEAAMAEIESAMADFGVDPGILAAAGSVRKRIGPLCRVERDAAAPESVSLCMIVKNEEQHLARCLRSAKPVVDEIVIVDTGSTDRTRDIAAAFGARVTDVPWNDDFSAARNAALELASCEWVLVLDADEVLSARDHDRFRQTVRSVKTRPAAFRMRTRNYTRHVNAVGWQANAGEYLEEEGPGWIPSDKVRLFTRDKRIRFRYPVHELVEPALRDVNITIGRCDIPVHHYGKLQEVTAQDKTKAYRRLGRTKLCHTKGDSPALRELAIQASHMGQHEEAIRLWEQWVQLHPGAADAYLNIGAAWWNLGHYSEAADFADKALRLDPDLKEAFFNRASARLMSGRAEEARCVLEDVLTKQADYPAARFMLGVAYACLGDPFRAEDAIEPLKELAIGEYIGESFADVVQRMVAASLSDYAVRILEAAIHMGYADEHLTSLVRGCRSAAE